MNKFLTKIAGLFLGMAMAIGVGVAVGSNKEVTRVDASTEAGFTAATMTAGTNGSSCTVNSCDGIKVGTSKAGGNMSITVPSGATKLVLYAAAWNGVTGLSLNITKTSGAASATISSSSIALTADAGISNNSPFTLSGTESNYRFELTLTNITANTVYKFAGSTGKRFVVWSAQTQAATASKTLSSIALSGTYPTSFTVGDSFSHEGMTVTATYSDSTNADVTSSAEFSGYDMNTAGEQTVTVSYTEGETTKTAEYSITVNAQKTPKSLSSSGQTTTFDSGDKFAYGGSLTVTYTDETTNSTISPASFKIGAANIDPTSEGTVIVPGTTVLNRDDHNGKTVYVFYTENNATVYTSYVIAVNAISSVTFTAGTDKGTTTGNNSPDEVTKSGITMYCDDAAFATDEYRYYSGSALTFTSTVGKMAKIEFTGDTDKKMGNISLSSGGGTISKSGNDATWTAASGGTNEVSFNFSAQNRAVVVKVTLASTDPLVELDASSATSVSMMKGDPNTAVKVHVLNITNKTWTFTFDEGEEEGLSTSSYISVSAGEAVNDVHTLTITTKAVGSTVLHISVSGTTCATTIPVTVNPKPASMQIVHSDISEGVLEIITGANKQVSFSGKDTDGNGYAIAAGDVTPSATSGASHVTLSGSQITGASEGDAVVRYTLKALTSVYAEITVHVVDDYIATVGTPTFATNLADTQGQSPTVAVFTSRPGTMYSGASTTIPFENYKFSYDETYASAKYASAFTYDFSHGATVDSTHKTQTINVFCDIDEAAHGSYTITVEQLNDPLTAIAFTNVTNNELDITRGNTFQLEWSYTPENPTDGKEVEFVIDDNTDGIDITVSSTGLISIGASSDLGTALVLIQSAHDDTIQDYVYVTAVLESMKYTVSETESWTKVTNTSTLAAGDVIIIASDTKGKVLGSFTGTNKYADEGTATFSNGSATNISGALEFTLESGSTNGKWKFKNGTNYLTASDSKTSMCLSETSMDLSISISSGNATIGFTGNYRILHNVNSTRFSNYDSNTSTSMLLPQIYKKNGGNTEMDVTDDLYNAIHNNFGVGQSYKYQWNESCSTFDQDGWLDACIAITEITDYDDYKLNRAVGNMSGNEVEVFLAKYDIIIGKVGTNHDHLGRFSTGGVNAPQRTTVNPTVTFIENNEAILIIALISIATVTCAGGYFFLRRRKED